MTTKNNTVRTQDVDYSTMLRFCLSKTPEDYTDMPIDKRDEWIYNFAMLQAHNLNLAYETGGLERLRRNENPEHAKRMTDVIKTSDANAEIFLMPEKWYGFAAHFSRVNRLGAERQVAAHRGEYEYYMSARLFDDAILVSRHMLNEIDMTPQQDEIEKVAREFYVCATIDQCNYLVEKCKLGEADWYSAVSAAVNTQDKSLIEDVSLMAYESYMKGAAKLMESGTDFLMNAAEGYEVALRIAHAASMPYKCVLEAAVGAYSAYAKEVAHEQRIIDDSAVKQERTIRTMSYATISLTLLAGKYELGTYNVLKYAKAHFRWELEATRYDDLTKKAFEWATRMKLDANFVEDAVKDIANSLYDEGFREQAETLFDELSFWKRQSLPK